MAATLPSNPNRKRQLLLTNQSADSTSSTPSSLPSSSPALPPSHAPTSSHSPPATPSH
ncbi:hypothetical protein LINPERHAP2_LOCUS6179 [Linum perenne]